MKFLPIGIFFMYVFIIVFETEVLYQMITVIDKARIRRIR